MEAIFCPATTNSATSRPLRRSARCGPDGPGGRARPPRAGAPGLKSDRAPLFGAPALSPRQASRLLALLAVFGLVLHFEPVCSVLGGQTTSQPYMAPRLSPHLFTLNRAPGGCGLTNEWDKRYATEAVRLWRVHGNLPDAGERQQTPQLVWEAPGVGHPRRCGRKRGRQQVGDLERCGARAGPFPPSAPGSPGLKPLVPAVTSRKPPRGTPRGLDRSPESAIPRTWGVQLIPLWSFSQLAR